MTNLKVGGGGANAFSPFTAKTTFFAKKWGAIYFMFCVEFINEISNPMILQKQVRKENHIPMKTQLKI